MFSLVFLVVCWSLADAHITNQTYSFLKDSSFEDYGAWKINPLSAWCTDWCTKPASWDEHARTGDDYIMAQPSKTVDLYQEFNYTKLDIAFDACLFRVYIRIVETSQVDFTILWNGKIYAVSWDDYYKGLIMAEGEWVQIDLDLEGMSDILQMSISTGTEGWMSLDDVSLVCYNYGFFHMNSFQIFIFSLMFIVIVLTMIYITKRFHCELGKKCRRLCPSCWSESEFTEIELEEEVEHFNTGAFINSHDSEGKSNK
jgi:hypothetical protein